ncbi:MAG: twin-arginine translocase TatA/TatE family subunit [Chloroflexi bacterium]|nr:twin-arginine translocase TatA/TatE family subunit [Chloroflexota bacterium]
MTEGEPMRLPGGFEWIIILVIIVILFGPGRIGKVAGELGKGIRSLRDGLSGKEEEKEKEEEKKEDENLPKPPEEEK